MKDPINRDHNDEPHDEPNDRRRNNESERLDPPFWFQQTAETPISRDRCAAVSAYQRMRARCWQPEIPGDQIPDDRAQQATTEYMNAHVLLNQIDTDQISADCFRDPRSKDGKSDEVENCRRDHRIAR